MKPRCAGSWPPSSSSPTSSAVEVAGGDQAVERDVQVAFGAAGAGVRNGAAAGPAPRASSATVAAAWSARARRSLSSVTSFSRASRRAKMASRSASAAAAAAGAERAARPELPGGPPAAGRKGEPQQHGESDHGKGCAKENLRPSAAKSGLARSTASGQPDFDIRLSV